MTDDDLPHSDLEISAAWEAAEKAYPAMLPDYEVIQHNRGRLRELRRESFEDGARWQREQQSSNDPEGAEAKILRLQTALDAFMQEGRRLSPVHPLSERWKIGERVELAPWGHTGARSTPRPGTVSRIVRTYGYHESLVVAFDDGEERAINPDVMRHIEDGDG